MIHILLFSLYMIDCVCVCVLFPLLFWIVTKRTIAKQFRCTHSHGHFFFLFRMYASKIPFRLYNDINNVNASASFDMFIVSAIAGINLAPHSAAPFHAQVCSAIMWFVVAVVVVRLCEITILSDSRSFSVCVTGGPMVYYISLCRGKYRRFGHSHRCLHYTAKQLH